MEVSKHINYTYVQVGNKVDDIRSIIELASKVSHNILFVIENGEDLTLQAQNAILKLAEEPPKNVRLVILTTDLRSLLPTTRSRGIVFGMPNLTRPNLQEYLNSKLTDNKLTPEQVSQVLELSTTFSDIDEFLKMDITEFINFCNKVISNIGKASTLNAFKISNSIQLKPQNVGYNPLQFFKGVKYLIHKNSLYKRFKVVNLLALKITNKSINHLAKSSSPQMVLDNWIIDIKKLLKQHKEEEF
jgi:DNA polymerase III delta prime subunit